MPWKLAHVMEERQSFCWKENKYKMETKRKPLQGKKKTQFGGVREDLQLKEAKFQDWRESSTDWNHVGGLMSGSTYSTRITTGNDLFPDC